MWASALFKKTSMSDFSDAMNDAVSAALDMRGEPITYIPNQGTGDPLAILCTLDKPQIGQSTAPGYFADIGVSRLDVPAPQRKDVVVWVDQVQYVVDAVRDDPYGFTMLALKRKVDR